jgi:hypothetical protein
VSETLNFTDLDDGTEALVIIRPVAGGVGLTLSKQHDGDVEVFMPSELAKRLASALHAATS